MKKVIKDIKKWLESGTKLGERRFKWTIDEIDEGKGDDPDAIMATSEMGEIEILIYKNYGTILHPSAIDDTVYWDNTHRLRAYRTVLRMNDKVPMASAFLYGEDDDLFILASFNVKDLSKNRLQEMINNVFFLEYLIHDELVEKGVIKEVSEDEEKARILEYVVDQLGAGKSGDEVAEEIMDMVDGEFTLEECRSLVKAVEEGMKEED